MPLTEIQKSVLRVLARRRSKASYLAGGAVLNRNGPRLSDDIDIFHDDEAALKAAAEADSQALREAGFMVVERVDELDIVEVIVRSHGAETMVQWMTDDPRRFYPVVADPECGFRLHDNDNAVNKLCAAASRREVRDVVDLIHIAQEIGPLGPLAWAATDKLAMGPGRVIEEVRRRHMRWSDDLLCLLATESVMTARQLRDQLDALLTKAEAYVQTKAPTAYYGCLFVDHTDRIVEATGSMINNKEAFAKSLLPSEPTPKVRNS